MHPTSSSFALMTFGLLHLLQQRVSGMTIPEYNWEHSRQIRDSNGDTNTNGERSQLQTIPKSDRLVPEQVHQFPFHKTLPLCLNLSSDISFETSFQDVSNDMSRGMIRLEWSMIFQTEEFTQQVIDDLLSGYDPRIPPNYEEDFPVEVIVQLHITNIDSISESNMDYTIGMFLRQSWHDSRLKYKKLPRLRSLELDSRLMDKIWVPDLFMANEKEAHFHLVTVPNKLMHIYPEGRIQYSIRVTATLKCNMDLRKYPLDRQKCSVIMESYGYSTENVIFTWNDDPVPIHKGRLILPQFELGAMNTLRCDKQYVGVNYTCIMMEFEIARSFGYYITQVYIPSILIVILSWVSFWLDIDAVPARISLGLLTVLTMTTQSAGARASLPKVSYIKGIDVWMAACLVFVFAALIEFAYVNVLSRVEKRRRSTVNYDKQSSSTQVMLPEKSQNGSNDTVSPSRRRFLMFRPSREKARTVDRTSRLAFPTSFIVFNLIYWCVYLFWEPDRSEVA